MAKKENPACPCGSPDYASCCGRFIDGKDVAQTAEQLMRSRYSAYAVRNDAYLKATWHPSTRPSDNLVADEDLKWLGLEVRRHVPDGDRATVEFVARCKSGGKAQRLHEVSNFVREEGQWLYVDGSFPDKKTS
jgi:SEC-C motif domain protein